MLENKTKQTKKHKDKGSFLERILINPGVGLNLEQFIINSLICEADITSHKTADREYWVQELLIYCLQ